MDGPTGYMLSEIKERQIPYNFTHVWNLRNKTNEQRKKETNKKTLLTTENKLVVARGKVGGGMDEIGKGD